MEQYVYKKIEGIEFSVMSPKIIKGMSVCKVVTPELYDKEGYPVDGGLMDTRMGVIDPGLRCRTDGRGLHDCPGYFGHIELARPVVHIKFVPIVLSVLRSFCGHCGRILVPQEKIQGLNDDLDRAEHEGGFDKRRAVLKTTIAGLKTTKKCPHCGAKQGKISIEKPTTFIENEKRISPIEIRSRLEKIPDDDLQLFGLHPASARPEWMVLTIMPIPPVTMRPSITLETGERSEDDFTHKLGDIVRINQRLFENINAGAPEIIIEDLWDLLQYHITTFFDNEVAQLPPARHRNGQPLKTLASRIKSKEGRIRYNLAGKRTNFNARTVISPDPMLEINEVGVPLVVARKLTVPQRVTEWNIGYLKQFVERGPDSYPGANYIVRPDGRRKTITDETKEALLEELQPGFVVERQLMDGDVAIFNRQPSLHRMSMMCHKVRVLPGKTFRMNPAVNAPYNADFDGDEMNLHIPQTEEARAEAEILMQVQTQMISPAYGLSIIGCVQDAISGNYLLTKDDMEIPRNQAVELLYAVRHKDFSKLPNSAMVTGKQVFSCLLPQGFDFEGTDKFGQPVRVVNGMLEQGVIDVANLGGGKGMLLRKLNKEYGADVSVGIVGKIFRMGIEVTQLQGFTSGISDIDLPQDVITQIQDILVQADKQVNDLIKQYHAKQLDQLPGRTLQETVELRILEALNKARNEAGNLVADTLKENTGTAVMVNRGGRGSIINIAQMVACVGQQALRGHRIDMGYNDRTLSSFKQDDLSGSARGFISNCFKGGLQPDEFFFQAMTGRDSLMDTALRTPKSGYLYRRLANAMQDLKVEYDQTVRDASGRIVQFQYGEDSVDVSKSEGGKINVKRIVQECVGGAL
ncbi:MAG: DNA-directed RNA polymerase subunit A' [Candidatus Woesearchaeota archaeon]